MRATPGWCKRLSSGGGTTATTIVGSCLRPVPQAEDEEADRRDRKCLPSDITALCDDEVDLTQRLVDAGMDRKAFQDLLVKHGVDFSEICTALQSMEAKMNEHNEKLDKTITMLTTVRRRPGRTAWHDLLPFPCGGRGGATNLPITKLASLLFRCVESGGGLGWCLSASYSAADSRVLVLPFAGQVDPPP